MKPVIIFCSIVFLMFVTLTNGVQATDHTCVIPVSGPWPSCATGAGGGGSTDCAIPPSGPWPPCATGGGNSGSGECVIPASGPWPSCATGGGNSGPDDCVIPTSGPWPSCATGGGGGSGSTDCVIPASGPWPPCATGGSGGGNQTDMPVVISFVAPDKVIGGNAFAVTWNVTGIVSPNKLTLVEFRDNGIFDDVTRHQIDPAGSLTINTPTNEENFAIVRYSLTLEFDGKQISQRIQVKRDCTWQWYFLPPSYDFIADQNSRKQTWGYCPSLPIVSQASQQQFERGFMVWIEEFGQIWAYNSVGNRLMKLQDVYMPGVDIVSDPDIVPPEGLLQPEFGFGKIWRENPGIRDALGWATAKPVNYQTVDVGNGSDGRNLRRFLRLANGDILLHSGDGLGVLQELERYADLDGFAHPNNGFRIIEPPACVIPASGPWPPCATGG